jgi:hypothetical protein
MAKKCEFRKKGGSSRLAQNEKPIHSRMHLFNGAEVTECFYTGKTDPDRDLVIDFRLKAVPEFFQIYLSDTGAWAKKLNSSDSLSAI